MKKKNKSRRHSFVANPRKAHSRRAAAPHKTKRHGKKRSFLGAFKRRSYRKNPGNLFAQLGLGLGVGILGGIAGAKAVSFIPVRALFQSLILAAAGVAIAVFGRKRPLLLGAGSGMAIVGGYKAAVSAVPLLAGDNELTGDEQEALLDEMAGDYVEGLDEQELAGTMSGTMQGTMNGTMQGDNEYNMNA